MKHIVTRADETSWTTGQQSAGSWSLENGSVTRDELIMYDTGSDERVRGENFGGGGFEVRQRLAQRCLQEIAAKNICHARRQALQSAICRQDQPKGKTTVPLYLYGNSIYAKVRKSKSILMVLSVWSRKRTLSKLRAIGLRQSAP